MTILTDHIQWWGAPITGTPSMITLHEIHVEYATQYPGAVLPPGEGEWEGGNIYLAYAPTHFTHLTHFAQFVSVHKPFAGPSAGSQTCRTHFTHLTHFTQFVSVHIPFAGPSAGSQTCRTHLTHLTPFTQFVSVHIPFASPSDAQHTSHSSHSSHRSSPSMYRSRARIIANTLNTVHTARLRPYIIRGPA